MHIKDLISGAYQVGDNYQKLGLHIDCSSGNRVSIFVTSSEYLENEIEVNSGDRFLFACEVTKSIWSNLVELPMPSLLLFLSISDFPIIYLLMKPGQTFRMIRGFKKPLS